MKKYFSGLLMILISFTLLQCAKKGTPQGGDLDTEPPKFLRATPENYSTQFNKEEIRIYFDEYIKLADAQKQIIISPPMAIKPEITPLGSPSKYIRIRLNDTLRKNTTYSINFGKSIIDNNEGNPLPYFKYVFSTGDYIDSLSVAGTVSDALLKEADPFISVMLYDADETYNDSLVFTTPPRYITNTLDSLRSFELTNIKEGKYHLVAVRDLNNDYKYNPGKEKIAFLKETISVPTDTSYNLQLFKEKIAFEAGRPKQVAKQKILVGYKGKTNLDSISIDPLNTVPSDFEYRFTKVVDKDSLYLWYKPIVETDSLRFKFNSQKDTTSLIARISDMKADSLVINTEPSGTLEFNKDFLIKANTPLTTKDDSLIKILNKDSLEVAFTSELKNLENSIHIKFNKNENETYSIQILPGAITDFFNAANDTIYRTLKTKTFSDYGNVRLNLQNVKSYPIIVQLTDEKGVIKAEIKSEDQSNIAFELVPPGEYLIRVIYDSNANGIWDTGNFLLKTNPEEIIYFPDFLEVRPNWDINQTFILK
ncbi:Ig-like domain-containing protein [Gillisia sp. JM1]|uniref:Ig-like domain-containing protein n=1 Tax=Gillisia sp. JM1 TaxID=1283286 RepID=UPI0003FC76F6|nr:Ig-like domain-containing protein [Gillisia sp. JM1]